MKPFKNESDMRRWIRKKSREEHAEVFWVEAASGGTHGFPDTVSVNADGTVTFFELKVGELLEQEGMVLFTMGNAQRMVLRRLAMAGARAIILVGEKDGTRVWAANGDAAIVRIGLDEEEGEDVESVKGRIPHVIPADFEFYEHKKEMEG